MDDLDELAEAASAIGHASVSSSIRIGSVLVPKNAVELIEPYEVKRQRPISYLGIAFMVGGVLLALAGDRSNLAVPWVEGTPNVQTGMIGGVGLLSLGLAWLWLMKRRLYGWTVRCFHREPVSVLYRTPGEAERMLAYLRANLPHVPVSRPQETVFWFIRF